MTDKQSLPLLKMIDLNAYDVFAGMVLAFFLCAALSRLVRLMPSSATSDRHLPKTMIFLGAIVCLIMAVIGNSLARAFGAIGALSLIRFRTAVKSSNDLAYLFMAISVGMACGSGYFAIATGATALFAVFILVVEKFLDKPRITRASLLKIVLNYEQDKLKKLIDMVKDNSVAFRVLKQEAADSGQKMELLVEITLPNDEDASELINKLCDVDKDVKASMLID